jgi:putative ABC transport system substrate-binding protein
MITRRKLLVAFGASALTVPLALFAQQQSKVWRVGFLSTQRRPDSLDSDIFGAFSNGMRELGYVEGKNLVIEWRFGDGQYERLPALAAELVKMKVDAIVTEGTPGTIAAQKATMTIPIVFGSAADPVGDGLVKSLARPGGNTTGLSILAGDIFSKLLEMLLSMIPKLSRVAILVNPDNSSHATLIKSVQTAAQRTRVKILPVKARSAQEIENSFAMMAGQKIEAVLVSRDSLFHQQRRQVVELANKYRLPSIGGVREHVEAGGLMSYGPNLPNIYGRAATYVDKILKGAKPGDLPVEQPTTFELFINRKTAKALGLTIPQELLLRADKVIE